VLEIVTASTGYLLIAAFTGAVGLAIYYLFGEFRKLEEIIPKTIMRFSIGIWAVITTIVTIWYIYIKWRFEQLDAEYAAYPDFRLASYLFSGIPEFLIFTLIIVLLLERNYFRNRSKF
jgi:hypothetical protein